MSTQNEWNAKLELLVQGLVMPGFHTQPCADATTKGCHPQERGLGDAPLGTFSLPFVDAIDKERKYVDDGEVDQ